MFDVKVLLIFDCIEGGVLLSNKFNY